MQGDGLESRFSYPDSFAPPPFPPCLLLPPFSPILRIGRVAHRVLRAHRLGVNEFRRGKSEEVSI